jgi:hypothetical protein
MERKARLRELEVMIEITDTMLTLPQNFEHPKADWIRECMESGLEMTCGVSR